MSWARFEMLSSKHLDGIDQYEKQFTFVNLDTATEITWLSDDHCIIFFAVPTGDGGRTCSRVKATMVDIQFLLGNTFFNVPSLHN